MLRRTAATATGGALVLVGGYFILHDAFGFVVPQFTFTLPRINWPEVATLIAGGIASVSWAMVWPTLAVILGLLLLTLGRRTRFESR